MVIHSFAVYLLTSTFVFIFSRRLWHSLEIQRSQNLPGSEIRGRRSKAKTRPPDFKAASWGRVTFCLLYVRAVLMGSDSSGRLLEHWCCGVYGFSKFVSPTFIVHWVYKSARSEFPFFPLQISDHISKLWFPYLYNQHIYAYVEEL